MVNFPSSGGEVQMKFYERSLRALLSSAPRGFAARSRVFARLASLAQTGELARRLCLRRRRSKLACTHGTERVRISAQYRVRIERQEHVSVFLIG